MLRWCVVLGLLLVPGVQACSGATSSYLDLAFPRPDDCGRTQPEACPPLPEADVPYVVDGILTWGWESDACSAKAPSAMPVHIHLDPVEREAAGWLSLSVEPREILIPVQDQWDVLDDVVDPSGTYRAQEQYPVRVTVSLVGEPSPAALERVAARNGLAQVNLKASAEATDTFAGVFTLQEFFFDGRPALEPAQDAGREAPALSPSLVALALVALAVLARRPA